MTNKGFRKIDNELFWALIAAQLPGAVYQVVLTIIDLTIGFRQKKAAISLSRFQERTRLSRQSVSLAIKQAEQRRIISTERHSTKVTIYALNTDASQWLTSQPNHPSGEGELVKQITLEGKANHTSASQPALPTTVPAKDTPEDTFKDIPVGAAKKQPAPLVTLIFEGMRAHLGYSGKPGQKDPIPSYGKEGKAIKRMLSRGYSHDDILACWKGKVADRGGDFVTMVYVNADIGKQGGRGQKQRGAGPRPRALPKPGTYHEPFESEDAYQARMAKRDHGDG